MIITNLKAVCKSESISLSPNQHYFYAPAMKWLGHIVLLTPYRLSFCYSFRTLLGHLSLLGNCLSSCVNN